MKKNVQWARSYCDECVSALAREEEIVPTVRDENATRAKERRAVESDRLQHRMSPNYTSDLTKEERVTL